MVKSASRVLELLEMFTEEPDSLALSDVARGLNLPKSSTQALLQTLVARGYLLKAGFGYEIDPALKDEQITGRAYWHLTRMARPIMEESALIAGETAVLSILAPDFSVRYIAKSLSPNAIRHDPALCSPRPPHSCSPGLLFLAFLPEAALNEWFRTAKLEKFAQNTITDPKILRKTLLKFREQGYSESIDGYINGAAGVCFPIQNTFGRMLATLHLSAPTDHYLQKKDLLLKEARRASAEMIKKLQTVSKAD